MADGNVSNDEFHVGLASLYQTVRENGRGSVFVIQKPYQLKDPSRPARSSSPVSSAHAKSLSLIIRATNGSSRPRRQEKVKISTIVLAQDLQNFFTRIGETSKAGMTALKRKKKKQRILKRAHKTH